MTLATALAELKASLDQGNEALTTKHFRLMAEALEAVFSSDGGDPETLFNLHRVRFNWLSLGAPTTLTIATGAVTATRSYHTLDTEAAAATDDLDTINGGEPGDLLLLRTLTSGRDVVVKDGTGNMFINGDFTLGDTRDVIVLIKRTSSEWAEVCRSDNN
jgi:hypothetical protein